MRKSKRIENFILGLLIVLAGFVLLLAPENGYWIINMAFAIVFTVIGIRNLTYYFSLARFMTNGLMALFRGIIFADLGLFAFSMLNMKKEHAMLFLMIGFMIAGVVDVSKALQLQKISSPVWKINLVEGVLFTILPFIGVTFFSGSISSNVVYACIIFFRGLVTLLSAFRRTAIVYVNE